MIERPPFRHAADALQFLFNPDRAACDRPPAARLADKHRGDPGQLSGLDGAATAASATAMLEGRLTPSQLAVLACRFAPSKLRCECTSECCSGWRVNPKWRQAISYVAHDAMYQALRGADTVHLRYVTAVLLKEYGKDKVALTDIGTDLGMALGTCTNHRKRIMDWLLRPEIVPKETKGEKELPALPRGTEVVAYMAAEESLRLGGFIQ